MNRLTTWFSAGLVALSLALVAPVHAQQPIKIGFGMASPARSPATASRR